LSKEQEKEKTQERERERERESVPQAIVNGLKKGCHFTLKSLKGIINKSG
jgi:hypothetical protein